MNLNFIKFFIAFTPLVFSQSKENNQEYFNFLRQSYKENSIDTLKAQAISEIFLKKAKEFQDSLKICEGYHLWSKITPLNTSRIYCDSIIKINKKFRTPKFLCSAYIYKGRFLYESDKYTEALDLFLKAQKIAVVIDDLKNQIVLNVYIGCIKELYSDKSAITHYKGSYRLIEENELSDDYFKNVKVRTLLNIANYYIKYKKIDSAEFYNLKSLELMLSINQKEKYYNYYLGIKSDIDTYHDKFHKSIDNLKKISQIASNKNESKLLFVSRLKNLGYNYFDTDRIDLALACFHKIDSLNNLKPMVHNDVYEAYVMMSKIYKIRKDQTMNALYSQKALMLNSKLKESITNVNVKINKEFYLSNQMLKFNRKINDLKKENLNNFFLFGGLIMLFIVFFVGLFYYNKRKNKIKNSSKTDLFHQKKLSKEMAQKIINQIDLFIKNEDYLKPNLNLEKSAKIFGTNPKYLSQYINHSMQTNFNSFVNDLRIEYAVKKIKEDENFRNKSIKTIALEIGFTNPDSFSKTFCKKTSKYPSVYIKEIKLIFT